MKSKESHLFTEKAVLYYLGGSLCNFITAVLALAFFKKHFLIFGGIIIYELSVGIQNIIPNLKRNYNDGTVIRLLVTDRYNGELLRRQMDILSDILLSKTLSEIECIDENIEVEKENDLSFFLRMMKVYLELERGDAIRAEIQIGDIAANICDYSIDMQNRFLCEKLFIYSLNKSHETEKIYEEYMATKPRKDLYYYISILCYETMICKNREREAGLKKILERSINGEEDDTILRLKLRML
ncbi:MAG: hypothetical protein IK018_04255 [Lachnospiraceae bacterium]|nr:hypothetical protein [Lachnospiraceae bacterium]